MNQDPTLAAAENCPKDGVHLCDPSYWHPYDVVGHLVHGERTDWIPRARIILNEGESRAFDPFDREAMFGESEGESSAGGTLSLLIPWLARYRER